MGPAGRLRSFLVGLYLISVTVADCPTPWVIPNTDFDDNSECPESSDAIFRAGCKLRLKCSNGFIPTSDKWSDLRGPRMLCGDDELWRDSTGTILDMREDDPNVLVCMQACNYSIDPVAYRLMITKSPDAIYNFTNPYDGNKLTSFIKAGDSFSIRCTGDRVLLHPNDPMSLEYYSATYKCSSSYSGNEFNHYESAVTNPKTIGTNCWIYCPAEFLRAHTQFKGEGVVNGNDRFKYGVGGYANYTCSDGYSFPPGSAGDGRVMLRIQCSNAEANTWTDMDTNQQIVPPPCIKKGQPGECIKLDTSNVTVLENTCEETATGVKEPCSVTVRCKQGMHPVDSAFLNQNNGSQKLLCQGGLWVNEQGSYASLMECTDGCIREIESVDTIGAWNQNQLPPWPGAQCWNITIYKQPPPYHPYYCEDLEPTATCNQSCRLQSPLPQGVQITNYTLDPQGYRTVLVKPRNFMFAGHSVVYSCKEGYMYPPDSSPARSGKNHQEIMCTIDRQLKDVYLNEVVPVVGCVPISGCPVLQPNDNVILSNQTNCAVDKNSYNNGCQLKYDCASGFYPAEEKYLIYDGQELNCNPAPNWYSPTIGASVNQTLTCIKGCVKMDWQQIIKQMNETTINIEMTTVKDTAGDDHYCFDTTTIQKVHDIWQNIMKGRNKYYCETQNRSETIDLTFSASFDCQKSCLVLDTSVLPSGLKLVTNPPTFTYTYNGKTYIGQNRSYVFQCEDGTNVFGEAPTYQQKLECDGVGYINPETGAPQTVADLKPCNKSPICPVKNTTTIIISADCQLVNNTVAVGCSVNTTCVPGFYPVDSVIVQNNQQSVTCNITKQNNATWITISTNETTEVSDCEPGTCPVPNNTDTVKVISSCQILNGQVTTNCNVTEQCVEGLVPVDTTGVVDGKRDSRCDTVSGKNGTLIVIGVGQPLPPLNCTNKPQCIVRPNTTEVLVTTEICRSSPAALGCIMHEECVEGLYPINITDITQLKQTSICNVTTNGTATWIDISLGTPTSPREGCAVPCNTTTPPGTKLTHQCVGVQGGVTVGCSASLVCEDDLVPINIDGKALTNMTCDGKGHNSTWIDISTGQPARQDACGCPAPEFKNGTNINSTCYVAGVGGPPGCTVDATCAPGTAPIYGQTGVTTNTTIVCKNDTTTGKTTWIDISIGQPFAGKYCPRVCPPISIPNTRVEIQCPTTEGGYAVDCPARVICIDGYVGYNVKYNKASVVNVTCKAITSDNSTFIEISTNETLEDFCEKETCKPINETNLVIISNCTVIGGAAPVNCSANATCKEGTLPVYIDGKTTVDTSIYCGKTGNQNATWIVISTGEPFPPEPCAPVCKYTEVPYTTIRTECVLKDGGYQVGCRVQVECIEGYTGININYKYSSVVNISCDSTDMKNSTFIELTTGLPLEASLCGARATTLTPIDCDPIDTATENVTGDCYLAGVGAPRGCEANVTCIPGTYPVHVNGKEKSTTTVVCKEDPTTKKTTWIDISTDQEYKSEDCRPPCPLKEIPHTSIKTECVRQDGGLYSVGCQVQLKCDPGYTGINVNYNYSSLVNISCNATTSQNSTFIELTTGQPVEADICGDKCDPINSTNAVPNATCYQMVNGAPVGCEVNVTCIPGTYPVNVTSNEATTTSVVCNKTTTGKNTWVDVSTGLEVPAKDCRKPCENLTSIPHSRSNYSCQPINLDGQYRVGCTATLECDEGYIPVNIVTGANGVINMKCSVVTSENSTFVEISTGLPLRGNVCIPACPEILPGPGVILIDQTCSSNSTYALDCRKNFACGEGTSPTNPGSPTNNSAVCKVDNGKPTWIDPATNQAYKPLDCPTPTGCTPITKDPTTEVTNRTCTPSNPPPSIHPENCVVDVECLKGYYPTEQGLRVYDEHKAECLKNNQTGKYEWYDRTVSAWWKIYTCTKGCLNETLPTQSNTSLIEGTPPKQCTFTTQPFGTGKYMCDLTEITTATCDNTCPKLIVNPPLTTGSEPEYILTRVVEIGGRFDIYCPDGWVWKGTTSASKTYTCTANGTYITSTPGDNATIVAVNDCVEPVNPGPNCTFNLSAGQEIISSSCDTDDEIYEENCVVTIKCKNGTYPMTNKGTRSQLCEKGEWVDPVTKDPLQPYPCNDSCKDISAVAKNPRNTSQPFGNTTVTCTIFTMEREMYEYICNKTDISPVDPIVEVICNNTCELIGLDTNLTNIRTVPNLVHNKVPLFGQTEVQCPPGTVFKETGSRRNWYTCTIDGTYNGPNGTTGLNFVKNTCIDPDSTPCPPVNTTNAVPSGTCYQATSGGPLGCNANFTCIPGTYPVHINGGENTTTSVVCNKTTTGKNSWIDISTGEVVPSKDCQPPCESLTSIPHTRSNYSCVTVSGGKYQVGCTATVECEEGYVPININGGVNGVINAKCSAVTSQNSTFINIATGQPVTGASGELCQLISTTTVSTSKPREQCVFWAAGEQRTRFSAATGNDQVCQIDMSEIASGPNGIGVKIYENCVINVYCTFSEYQVPANYGYENKSIAAVCNKTDENGGIWYVVDTGLPLTKLNCVNKTATVTTVAPLITTSSSNVVCPELVPGPGVIVTEQTCAPSNYALGCKKNLKCVEETSPTNPTGPTNNSAVCQLENGQPTWIDPSTNQPYKSLDCPTPTGCTPISIDPSTTHLTNRTCTPSNPPPSIHPETCVVDVECLKGYYPTEQGLRVYDEHKAECLKNSQTGKYEWYDRTVSAWWRIYTCTKGCLNETLPTQSNTSLIEGTPPKQCTFTTQPFGTGKYMCDLTEITTATCDNTCPKLIVNPPLTTGSEPQFILTKVVATGGKYDVYCPNGWVWKGTSSSLKTYTCLENGTYISSNPNEESAIVVISDCEEPTESEPNCTLTLTEGQEIVSSTCDTGDEIYEGNCLVVIKCKNGTYPTTKEVTQSRVCDDGEWVIPGTKTPIQQYSCETGCKDISTVIKNSTGTPSVVGNTTVTCTILTIEREMIKYICGNVSGIDPANPVVQEICNNTCNLIGLGVNLTNTRTVPNLIHNKVPLYGQTEVQCPPGTVFKETGSRTNWYTCMVDETYNGPNGTTRLTLVPNTCVDPDSLITTTTLPPTTKTPDITCPELAPGPGVVQRRQNCSITSKYAVGCQKDFECADGSTPTGPGSDGSKGNSAVCQPSTGTTGIWVVPGTGQSYVPLNCPTSTGCTPIPIDETSTHITNKTCTPSNGAVPIHPENCMVDVECLFGYYPTEKGLRVYDEHKAECLKNNQTGKYGWYDRTVGAWWKIYTCNKGCLNETLPTQSNTTLIEGPPQRQCTFNTLPFGTGKFMCDLSDITNATCDNTCPKLIVNPPLKIVTQPEFILTKVVATGGKYDVYCPDGWVWKGTTSASKTYTCLENGTYISSNPDEESTIVVIDDCEDPVNPGRNCTLTLTEGQEIVSSSCDTDDETYADNCIVELKCKNGTYPTATTATYEQECDDGGWVVPGTKTPVQPYPCNSSCLIVSLVPSKQENTTTTVGNVTVFCVITRIDRDLIDYVCNETFINPTNPIVDETCNNTCVRIGLGVNMTNTRTIPNLVRDKVPLYGQTEVQCPPGTVFKETGSRRNWYTCTIDGTYNGPNGTTGLNFVKNTCVDPDSLITTTAAPPPITTTSPTPPTTPSGCEDIKYDASTHITNKTCTPFSNGLHPEWCIVDVKCRNGTYPETVEDRNRSEHKAQCQLFSNGSFGWVDLTLDGVEWCPYKCINGCLPVAPGQVSRNTTITRVGPVTYVCEVVTVPHLTGGYYCNLTEDVISISCNGTCPPLQVNKPTTIIKAPTYIYGKLVPYGGTYEVSCPDSWFYNDTGLSVKNYTCEDGTYTDGNKTKGITVADDECTCVDGNCTLEVPENMIVEEVNCPIDDDIYAIGCQVKLRCKPGYRFARLNRTEWIAHIYDRWQCTLREERYIWIDTDSKEEACNDTCIPDKDCIDKGEINQNCYSVKETRLGKDVECQYCKYDTALDPYICPNVTRPENGTLDVCCDTCEELGIAEGLNKRRYAILIFKNKVAIGDYYTVECPTGQIFKETRTRGKNYTCNPGHKYTGPGGENITFVENTCIDEPPKGCGELPIDSSTFIINGTCTPFNGFPSIYPTNCTQDVKCKNGTRPELEGNLKYSWHSVECWYNPGQNNYFWFDLTLNTRWTPYKCIDGCVNATEPLTNENTSVVVTKENNTLVCNITTVAYQTGPYFCNTDEDVVDDTADCNGTCLALIVEDPLAIGKGLEPLVYKELVIVKGTYHIICPEGKWYNETCNSTRVYICDKDGKYTSENKTRLDKAIDTCEDVDEETPNCTLTVGEGVEINHKYPNCPARTTSEYGISCAVQLRCKEGYYPVVKEWITQEQYCGNQGDNQSYWWLFEPPQKAPTFGCKKGCIGQAEMKDYTRKRQETTTYNGVTVVCDVEYIDTRLIDKLCNKTSVKPSGEVSRSCSNTCRQLEMGPGMTYVPPSPHFFFGYVIRWDNYNVQCPNGKVWPETLTERKLFTCNQDGKYNTSTQTGLTIALDTCIPCPPTEAPTTTEPTTMTTPIPTCPDRAAPAKGTIFYNYTCSSGKNFKDCQLSYKCEINWYPTRVEDRTLLNRTAVCNGKIWIDKTTGKEFVDFGCSQGCLNDSSSLPRVTRVEQQVQIGDTTVCCNKTYIDGITRLYYCNYTQELSINCTETCKPLIVPQPPMTVVFYPERRVPNLNLIFRGTKYTVSCPAGKVFSGTNESYRNYTCDYNGKYYTETKGDLTSAETDCVDSTNPSTCTLSAPASPAQLTSPNCGGVKDGKYAVSCVVYLACPKGNYPSLVEDQAYPNRTVECKIQQDGSVAWENIRSGKIVTDPYGCKSGCLTTAPAVEPITISGMNCEVVSIPVGSIDYQCDASDYLADGVKKSNCTNGCKDLPLDTSYIETSGPTILYHHVTNGTNYTVFCPPGMYFSTTTTSSQTFTCVNGVYKEAETVTINPNSPTTGLGTCINPPPSGPPSKAPVKLQKPCKADNPGEDKVQLLATMNPSKDQGAVTAVPNSSVAENNILLPPPANDQQGTEDDDSKYYGNVCVAPW